jgi:hypothetical protein
MSRIFISYSRRDLEIVNSIVEKIEAAGMGVWIDREDIKAGKTWRVQIVEAIATCDAFVLMLSSNSAASDNVRREIDLAQDAGRAIFIMKLDPVKLPAEMLYPLVGLQHIELQRLGIENGVHRLIETLDEYLATWKPHDDRTVRQVELVFQEGARAEFGVKKQEQMLSLISALTETLQSQLGIANLAAGGVHVFVDMPAAAAFELKTRALNRDRRLQQFGIKSLRVVGDKQYVNTSLGILTTTATIGTLNMLWMHVPSLFPSLFGVVVGKVIVITTVVVATTAVGIALADGVGPNLSPAQPAPFATNPTAQDFPSPTSDGGMTIWTSTPTSISNPTIPTISTALSSQTIAPTPSPTITSAGIPSTPVPSPMPTLTMMPAPPVPATPTDTPPPAATHTLIPSDTPTPTATQTATATILPPVNEPTWTGGWTHINPGPGEVGSGQTFIPSDSNLLTVDVSILTGNPGRGDDTITLKILSANQQVLGMSSQVVADGFDGWLQFQFPGAGLMLTPGDTFMIALADTGTTTFGWRYAFDTYPNGHTIMLGSDKPDYDFFFRINR